MNRVFLIGNLTRDPESSVTPNGVALCKFGIAVSRRFSQDEADFFNIVAWRGTAENCQKFLQKGSKVAIVGSIQTRTYEAQDGTRRTAVDVVADEVQFLSPKNGESSQSSYSKESAPSVNKLTPVDDDEQLPF